jgi:hypothetical protein
MSNSSKSKATQTDMDQTDIEYIIELLTDALREEDWDTVVEAREFLKEYRDDDGGPIELEE